MTKQIYKFDPDHVRFNMFVFTKNIFAAFLFFTKNKHICSAKQNIEHYGQTI